MTLAEKFTRLKTSVGGNREKMHFEDTFGMPKEEQAHITRPGRANARILAELEFALHLSEAENGKYDAALEEALDYLLEKQQTEGVLTDQACEEAEEILEPIAEEAKSYELILAAHAHIDMNWMWSFNETVSIVLATFRSILNIMDQYPEFCFSQSQASVYKIVEEYDPELMERIKARIAEGRWEVTASAWVETDKNMPSGESLLRHIQYTREYLSKVWGVKDFDLDFSPDTFGHSANVPEIDQFGGVKYFYHCRGNARRDVLYRYQAPSGKEVLTGIAQSSRAEYFVRERKETPETFVSEEELEEIFKRTYYQNSEPKSKKGYQKRCREEAPARRLMERSRAAEADRSKPRERYLLVDGYNIIFSWEMLRELSKVNIESARNLLMDVLCDYQGFNGCTLILVFDAYRVEGGQERVFNYHNIHVVFTKEAETADQYIEKTVHKIGKKADVTVATSDALEQVIIYGQGARRMAARELLEEVELTREKVLERIEKRPGSTQKQLTENDHNYLFDHLPEELVSYMEEVRLGKREL